jgi:6-pyruvoyl-tetrahydropterin synthase
MNYQQSFEVGFDAGHAVSGSSTCETPHGHHWVCVVVLSSSGAPNLQADLDELRKRLTTIAEQLHRRNLNTMLPGTYTNTSGVANWLWNELALHVPIAEVRVSADGATSIVRK